MHRRLGYGPARQVGRGLRHDLDTADDLLASGPQGWAVDAVQVPGPEMSVSARL
jgi:hypothetical protein